jgi:hypothetical protein
MATAKEKANRFVTIHINSKEGSRAVEEEFFMKPGESITKVIVTERVVTSKKVYDSSIREVENV